MCIKKFSGLALVFPFLICLCAGSVLSANQLSFPPGSQKNPDGIRTTLKQAGIIPDVLDDFVPSCSLHVAYASSHKVVRLGSKIKPSHTKKAPVVHVSCPDIKEVKSFTVALTDPDAPSRKDPEWSEMCHWIVIVPVAGGALLDDETFSEERHKGPKEIVEYKPPGPPAKTGYHRYVFVLLAGNNKNLTAPSERKHWGTGKERHGVRDWAEREGLRVVGANFFYAKYKK